MAASAEYKRRWYLQNRERLGYKGVRPGTSQATYDRQEREHLKPSCEMCGDKAVLVHHIDGDHFNGVPENRMSLCRACHARVHNPRLGTGRTRACVGCDKPIGYGSERCRSCARKLAWEEGVYAVRP